MPLIRDLNRTFDGPSPLLTDRCQIRQRDIEGTLNESTLEIERTNGTVIYDGPCLFQRRKGLAHRMVGGVQLASDELIVQIPAYETGVTVDLVLEAMDSHDPSLVGQLFEVRNVEARTRSSVRALTVKEWDSVDPVRGA